MESSKLDLILHHATGFTHSRSMSSYVEISLSGNVLKKAGGKTNVVVKDDTTHTWVWDYLVDFDIKPAYSECALQFQIFLPGADYDISVGCLRLPIDELLHGDVDKIHYPVKTSSGDVKGELVISHKISKFQQKVDVTGSSEDDVAAAGKKKKKKKNGFLKRIAEKMVLSAIVTTVATAISILSCLFVLIG